MPEDPLDRLFSTFTEEAFRVESLGQYKIDDTQEFQEFQHYLEGGLQSRMANQPWYDDVAAWKREGKRILRVRVLPTSWTPYLSYEFEWCYPYNCLHGEEIFVIGQADYERVVGRPPSDFWLFDRREAVAMNYSEQGEYLAAEVRMNVGDFVRARDKLLADGVPLQKYLSRKRTGS